MHNCKSVRSSLMELAFDELPPTQKTHVLAQLDECAECREEYASVRNALHVTDHELRSALPPESFWVGYHSRLRRRIENSASFDSQAETSHPTLWTILRGFATATMRVPVPIAAVVVLLLAFVSLLAMHARRDVNPQGATGSPTVETRTVEVPVTRDKVVTRVIYVERSSRRSRVSPAQTKSQSDLAVSASGDKPAVSLAGFKPAEQVKLTIMKGSYRDEK